MLRRIFTELYSDSPKANFAKICARLTGKSLTAPKVAPKNKVLDDLLASSCLVDLLVHALSQTQINSAVLAGGDAFGESLARRLKDLGREIRLQTWDWEKSAGEIALQPGQSLILLQLPVTEEEWQIVATLKRRIGAQLVLLTELLLPYTRITLLQSKVDYLVKSFEKILPYYLGRQFFGPLDKLDAVFPLRGKSVIEFGPFEACQTAGLVHLGAKSVTCIEARAENSTKTLAAVEVFGWSNVRLIMEDFHNVDGSKYGRFDLAFAHGVYYHSIAPFVFLSNLLTLADHVFVGGFCATDELPGHAWETLEYEGKTYRAKRYREAAHFTEGVNRNGWHFHGDDLVRFFSDHGWSVKMVTDEKTTVTAGRYIRFLASKESV